MSRYQARTQRQAIGAKNAPKKETKKERLEKMYNAGLITERQYQLRSKILRDYDNDLLMRTPCERCQCEFRAWYKECGCVCHMYDDNRDKYDDAQVIG